MTFKKLVIEFVTLSAAAFVTVTLVTFVWNFIGHGGNSADWETSFGLAIIFGIILTWANPREIKDK